MALRKITATVSILCLLATVVVAASDVWQKLFDGKSMNGWRLMAVHGGNGGVARHDGSSTRQGNGH